MYHDYINELQPGLDTTGHETAQQQHVQTPRCQIQLFGRSPGKCVTLGSFSIFQQKLNPT